MRTCWTGEGRRPVPARRRAPGAAARLAVACLLVAVAGCRPGAGAREERWGLPEATRRVVYRDLHRAAFYAARRAQDSTRMSPAARRALQAQLFARRRERIIARWHLRAALADSIWQEGTKKTWWDRL